MRASIAPLLTLTEDEAEEKGRELVSLINTDLQARETVLRRRAMLREMYAGLPDSMLDSENGVTIHLPVIAEKVDGTVPKVINSFWNAEPIVHVRRVAREYNASASELLERFLNWALITDILNLYQTFEQWVRNCLIDGVAVIKLYWDYADRVTVLSKNVVFVWREGETDLSGQRVPEERVKLPIEILFELFGMDSSQRGVAEVHDASVDLTAETDDLVGVVINLDIVEDRIRYEDVEVRFHESHYIDEITVTIKRPIITRDAPCAELIQFDDIVVPFRTDDLQTAARVTHICYYTEAKLRSKMRHCGYDLSEDDWLILTGALTTTPEDESSSQHNRILKKQKDRQIGETEELSAPDVRHGTYDTSRITVYEVYCSDDVNGDGINEEVIYIIPAVLRRVVRSYYLDELFPHGRRPFLDLHYRKEGDRWYSTGMAELLIGINMEVDAIISMVNYAQELINNPFYFYEPTTFLDDARMPVRGLRPGEGKMVSSVQGIMFPKFMQEPLANLSTMDSLLLFGDRLTLSPQSVGSSQVRNSPRTARGTLALLSEAGVKTDMFITAAQYGPWREFLFQVHALYSAYGPEEKWFYVIGQPEPHAISHDQMRGRYEFTFSGNTVNTNKEVMREIAQIRYATLISNPGYQMDLVALQNLTRDFLKYFGDGAEIESLIFRIPEQGGDHAPMDQKTELTYLMQGNPLGVLPGDNHAEHLSVVMEWQNSQLAKQAQPWQVAMVAMHGAMHAQALQRQQMQGGAIQPQSGAGMANNVPTQLNDLEGGVQ